MSTFGGVYFTNKGRALHAKALTGVQLNFTRLSVGDGSLTGQVIADLSNLIHEVKSIAITTLKDTNDGNVTIGGVLTNQGLSTGFYWREVGLFATDPDLGEILYCYGNAAALAEYIPADGGADLLEKQINIIAIIGNASNVSATIDQSLIFATRNEVNDIITQIPSKTSQLENDENFITSGGAPVQSVNTKTGAVVLSASDIKTSSGSSVESDLSEITTNGVKANGGNADTVGGLSPFLGYKTSGNWLPMLTPSSPLEIGQYIDFHLVGSALDYDGRLLLNANKDLYFNNGKVWTSSNDGAGSGLDADTVRTKTFTDTPATTEKTDIIGMINELFQYANNGKGIADVVGGVVSSNTFDEIKNRIVTLNDAYNAVLQSSDKSTLTRTLDWLNQRAIDLANQLTNKGLSSSSNEGLSTLIQKVSNIVTGRKFATGTLTTTTTTETFLDGYSGSHQLYPVTVTGLDFTPRLIILINTSSDSTVNVTIYNSELSGVNDSYTRVATLAWTSAVHYPIRTWNYENTSTAYVTTNSFKIPYRFGGRNIRWEAYE